MRKVNDDIADGFLKRLKSQFNGQVKKIILFGSRARGDNTEFSDYDFVIIFDEVTPQIREKMRDLAGEMLYNYNLVFSIFLFTEEDLKRKRYSPFIMNVKKEGVTV